MAFDGSRWCRLKVWREDRHFVKYLPSQIIIRTLNKNTHVTGSFKYIQTDHLKKFEQNNHNSIHEYRTRTASIHSTPTFIHIMPNIHGLFSNRDSEDDDSAGDENNRYVGGVSSRGGGRYG